jgi:aminopeptidase N
LAATAILQMALMAYAFPRERTIAVAAVACVLLVSPWTAWAQRLPDGVVPSHYDLTFRPALETATFSGEARIQVRVSRPTATIVLHAHELSIPTATVTQGGTTHVAGVTLDAEKQQATLRIPEPLAAGDARIALSFTGKLNDQLSGFYLGTSGQRRYAATQFEATDARRAFPCFDEPALKATFAVSMVVDTRDRAISNGRVVSDTPGPSPGTHTVTFATTKRMSTYLVALLAGDFACIEDTAAGVPLRVCALDGQQEKGRFAMEASKAFLTFFNEYYGIPYPFGKLDQIAIPDFGAGAMENTGAIIYREQYLLVDEQRSSPAERQQIANIIAHEIAHQWFGNLVTMAWWNDIWLNEGFATWAASRAVAAWKPEWPVAEGNALEAVMAVATDSVASTRTIRSPVAETPAQIFQLFDGIGYLKAATVLRMVEAYVGPEAFRRGVRAHLAAHQYGNATAEDLWKALKDASGKPVDAVMAGFVDQPGPPLVTLQDRCIDGRGTLIATQQRFFNSPDRLKAGSPERWAIPLCFKSATGAATCELLTESTQTLPLPACSNWTLGNAGAKGYYIAAYPADTVLRMARASAALTPPERLRFAADQFALVEAGQLGLPSYLSLVEALGHDQPYRVLEVVWRNVSYVEEIVPERQQQHYAAWAHGVLHGALRGIGYDAKPGDSEEAREHRAFLLDYLAFLADDAPTKKYLIGLADKYFSDPSSVDASLSTVAIRAAAQRGDAAVYGRMLAALERASAADVKHRLEVGLAEFESPELLTRTLRRSLTPAVRTQDLLSILFTAVGQRTNRPLVWTFIKSHFDELRARLGSPTDTALVGVVNYFCDASLRDDARAFFASHPLAGAEATLAQALERAEACIGLRTREEAGLTQWLQSTPRPAQ